LSAFSISPEVATDVKNNPEIAATTLPDTHRFPCFMTDSFVFIGLNITVTKVVFTIGSQWKFYNLDFPNSMLDFPNDLSHPPSRFRGLPFEADALYCAHA